VPWWTLAAGHDATCLAGPGWLLGDLEGIGAFSMSEDRPGSLPSAYLRRRCRLEDHSDPLARYRAQHAPD
jgi:hypothetical protein